MTLTPTFSDDLAAVAGVCHGFFGREGGASTGIYAHLNCGYGSGDAPDAVAENRRRVAEWMGPREPVLNSVHQVHGTTVIDLNKAWPDGRGPKADGLVSRTPGVALTVLSADCAPVLFADEGAGIVGAAHAGWRGALAGITDATITAMQRLGAAPETIRAAIGPCIRQESYEVGPEFEATFAAEAADNARYFVASDRPGHRRFDLPGYLEDRLVAAGLVCVDNLAHDTYGEPKRFFSYRRATHVGEEDYGRAASVIMLE